MCSKTSSIVLAFVGSSLFCWNMHFCNMTGTILAKTESFKRHLTLISAVLCVLELPELLFSSFFDWIFFFESSLLNVSISLQSVPAKSWRFRVLSSFLTSDEEVFDSFELNYFSCFWIFGLLIVTVFFGCKVVLALLFCFFFPTIHNLLQSMLFAQLLLLRKVHLSVSGHCLKVFNSKPACPLFLLLNFLFWRS